MYGENMTFLEALKSGRPIRRPWTLAESPWLYLGEDSNGLGRTIACWRQIKDGKRIGLFRWDYEADNWEVMA